MKILKLSKKAYKQYTTTVKGNEDTDMDQVARKLTRNIQIVKEKVERHKWMKEKLIHESMFWTTYCYGDLHIKVWNGKVIRVKNFQGDNEFEFFVPKRRYEQISKQLRIEGYEKKFSRKKNNRKFV
ncbi:hypothetical protein [Metabacillus arenae]|uniref:Uncharacterized protein n=1 Tax=Metabacillus arenae TaxID=2771434 RepID=A0A926NE01_9BACI|nr:hypothetical protein [Metabacillus arenae]MBD1379095.1 hypothetical protein [Metabacillus arenae]